MKNDAAPRWFASHESISFESISPSATLFSDDYTAWRIKSAGSCFACMSDKPSEPTVSPTKAANTALSIFRMIIKIACDHVDP